MAEPVKISVSKWATLVRCLRKYYYAYELNLRRKVQAVPLVRGSLGHECLQHYYKSDCDLQSIKHPIISFKKQLDNLSIEEREMYASLPDDAVRIMRGYHSYWHDDKNLRVWEDDDGLFIERELVVPITRGVHLVLIVDLLAEDQNGLLWIMDHKWVKGEPPAELRTHDYQGGAYYWALTKLGYKPEGVVWNYLRTKAPSEPKVLKDGTLSKAKIDTDRATYMAAIKKNGLNPADYEDMLSSLSAKTFFNRVRLPQPDALVETIVDELKRVGQMVRTLKGKPQQRFVRTLCRTCEWDCEFKPLCLAELQKRNTELMLSNHYEERRKEDDENGKEEAE